MLIRATFSQYNLTLIQQDPESSLTTFVTMDETWVHHFHPETKEQSKQWKYNNSPIPKKAKVTISAGKVMASVFEDAKEVLFIDYLCKGPAITRAYYANLFTELRQKIKEKRLGRLTIGVIFRQDKAAAHTSLLTRAKI
ncbi:uncharacterized protein LOC143028824 [Oratosquilla oratoria]|uniref:uncharacterized protein LOC143028824 n=1 Tax=Oratosquilla oratoria TaxID=337810 RepID=UPI003F758DCE